MKQKQNDKSDNYLMTLNLKVSIFLCLFLIYSFTASSTNGSTPPLATNDSVSAILILHVIC